PRPWAAARRRRRSNSWNDPGMTRDDLMNGQRVLVQRLLPQAAVDCRRRPASELSDISTSSDRRPLSRTDRQQLATFGSGTHFMKDLASSRQQATGRAECSSSIPMSYAWNAITELHATD
ncbi:hypothetical protein, partial [Streptomyces sp. NPDC056663]|uniref:hypothetical protein n=1 Tax=Streptomyces sp. NPDC056663 TaxID=3345899 RepID=UPI0036999D29